jgi:hypothetical protein
MRITQPGEKLIGGVGEKKAAELVISYVQEKKR